jgi:hypothetical protein
MKGDEFSLDYDPDGYPELPVGLDRRRLRLKQAA